MGRGRSKPARWPGKLVHPLRELAGIGPTTGVWQHGLRVGKGHRKGGGLARSLGLPVGGHGRHRDRYTSRRKGR